MIRPCPFCGSSKSNVRRRVHSTWHAVIECCTCGATGPEVDETGVKGRISTNAEIETAADEAIRLWNERQ